MVWSGELRRAAAGSGRVRRAAPWLGVGMGRRVNTAAIFQYPRIVITSPACGLDAGKKIIEVEPAP
jgi:hypothetical protein